MTCVAAFLNKDGSIVLGADSAGTGGTSQELRKDPKVFVKGQMIIGICGSFRMGNLLRFKLAIPKHPRDLDTFEYMATLFVDAVRSCLKDGGYTHISNNTEAGGVFIVGYHRRLFKIESDFQVGETLVNYSAIGCGEDIALGSLFTSRGRAENRVRKALEAATQFSCAVRPPFNIIRLKAHR